MPTLTTSGKIAVGVGIAVAAVGAYLLYKHVASEADRGDDVEEEVDSDGEVAGKAEADNDVITSTPGRSAAPAPTTAVASAGAGGAGAGASAAGPGDAAPAAGGKRLTRDQLCQILGGILQSTKMLATNLMAQQQKGQKLPAAELKQRFEMQSALLHQEILTRCGVSHEDFTSAMMEHKGDPTVRALMSQSLRMGEMLLPPVPDDVTVEAFLPQLKSVMEAFVVGTQNAVEEAKKLNLHGQELAQKTMELTGPAVQAAQEAALEKIGLSKEDFQARLSKFMANPEVQSTVMTAQQQAMQVVKDSAPELAEEGM